MRRSIDAIVIPAFKSANPGGIMEPKLLILSIVISLSTAANAETNEKQIETVKKISIEQAKSIALKKSPGKIKSSEFENEGGQDVYSFDIELKNHRINEVLVNAYSGKIVSSKLESAKEEAAEAREEQNESSH
jgi:hypothetical protein